MTKTDRQKETKKHKQTNNMTLDMFEKKPIKREKTSRHIIELSIQIWKYDFFFFFTVL